MKVALSHSLGFPRVGAQRELKKAVEGYWKGEIDQQTLIEQGRNLRLYQWQTQQAAGLDLIPVGDFAWYDQMLNHSVMSGAVPERFGATDGQVDLDTMFRMARGRAPTGEPAAFTSAWQIQQMDIYCKQKSENTYNTNQ